MSVHHMVKAPNEGNQFLYGRRLWRLTPLTMWSTDTTENFLNANTRQLTARLLLTKWEKQASRS